MTTYRDLEREKAKLDAQSDSLNKNGMLHHYASPMSTRTAAEAAASRATPESDVPVGGRRDHEPSGYCGSTEGVFSRVRDRMTAAEVIKAIAPKPETLYENEVRCFGKYWADVYAARRARGEN